MYQIVFHASDPSYPGISPGDALPLIEDWLNANCDGWGQPYREWALPEILGEANIKYHKGNYWSPPTINGRVIDVISVPTKDQAILFKLRWDVVYIRPL